ncbi:hypothetical protein Tco_0847475, partial [Tanacetum coccineum]
MVRSRCYMYRPRGMSSLLYTVWGSLQDITVGLFLGTTVGYDEANESKPDMSFNIPASLEISRFLPFLDPYDLHLGFPREFVISELLNDAIGVYHCMFDFSGVHIPFSSFLLALIKHYKIEPTVTLFRVFQTLCNQGHWFSFAKRHAPSPVCIDDNHSCMKHWKSGFFLIHRRAIPDYMSWRHLDSAINDPRPPDGSFNMEDVRRLSMHVVKLKDMPEGVLVLSGLSRVWKSQTYDLVLRGADGNGTWGGLLTVFVANTSKASLYYTHPVAADVVMLEPTLKDVAASNPSAKVVAKAEASQKQKTC